MTKTLAQIRDSVIHAIIQDEINNFLSGKKKRRCAYSGIWFTPKNRYHFFASKEYRKAYYRGQFKPRD